MGMYLTSFQYLEFVNFTMSTISTLAHLHLHSLSLSLTQTLPAGYYPIFIYRLHTKAVPNDVRSVCLPLTVLPTQIIFLSFHLNDESLALWSKE